MYVSQSIGIFCEWAAMSVSQQSRHVSNGLSVDRGMLGVNIVCARRATGLFGKFHLPYIWTY